MFFNGGDGLVSFGLGAAFALALEVGMHIFVHYTVPGATWAAGLAESLAPAMDGLGLTSIFSDAASGEVVNQAVNHGVTTTLPEVAATETAHICGGYCPIHNPITNPVFDPLTGEALAPAAESLAQPPLEAAPADPYGGYPELPELPEAPDFP